MQSTESSFENIRKDFPILSRTVRDNKPLVYLDNASTTQKPNQVIDAITDYYQNHNANIHRAVYALAEESTEAYENARDKITNLGDPGDLVEVKGGYARNFLIPSGKAIRADKENKAEFEKKKESLLAAEEERKSAATEIAKSLESIELKIPVAVSEEGTLYGSIGTREIAEFISKEKEIELEKSSIRLPEGALKELGTFEIDIELHPEVIQRVSVEISAQE